MDNLKSTYCKISCVLFSLYLLNVMMLPVLQKENDMSICSRVVLASISVKLDYYKIKKHFQHIIAL